jgi:hypothetical protein
MWVPGYEQHYYNPTTNRIPQAILGNWLTYALDETRENVGPAISRYDDIETPWRNIKAKPNTVPIVPVKTMTAAESEALRTGRGR